MTSSQSGGSPTTAAPAAAPLGSLESDDGDGAPAYMLQQRAIEPRTGQHQASPGVEHGTLVASESMPDSQLPGTQPGAQPRPAQAVQQQASPRPYPSLALAAPLRDSVPAISEDAPALAARPPSAAPSSYQQQQQHLLQQMMPLPLGAPLGRPPLKQEPRPVSQLQQGLPAAARPRGQQRKCVECGSTDTPMWRTHPVHGRGTLCNACGVKLYRQQCKDRTQREKQMVESSSWPSMMGAPGLGAQGLAGADDRGFKRQKLTLPPVEVQRQQPESWGRGPGGVGAFTATGASSGQMPSGEPGGASPVMMAPTLAKALGASAAGGLEGAAGALPPSMQQQSDPGIPGCQFAFRGQLPDGSIEPRAIHDVTITLHTPREPGSGITQSSLIVLDSNGGKLASYHTAELEPRLEYDQYLNAAVWDSRDGWWLLLPTPDHALAFQGLMRVLAARKLGMLHPPALPEPPVAQPQSQQAPLAPATAAAAAAAVQQRQHPPAPHQAMAAAPPVVGQRQGPPQPPQGQQPTAVATALQLLAQQLAKEQAAGAGRGGEAKSPSDMQHMLALLAQGIATGAVNLGGGAQGAGGGGGRDGSPRAQTPSGGGGSSSKANGHTAAPAPAQPPALGRPEAGMAGQSILPLAHQSRMERLFAAPPHHNSADPVPAIIKPPDRTGGEPHKHKPVSLGPNAFAAPSPAANLFQGFGGGEGSGGAVRGGGSGSGVAEQQGAQRASPQTLSPGQPKSASPQPVHGDGGTAAEKGALLSAQLQQQGQGQGQGGGQWALRQPVASLERQPKGQEQAHGASQISLPPEADAALRLLAVLQKQQQQCR